ncbi:MAG: hypothetical protein JEZ07_05635 [Phycisphaerae bacterium]|nr:hypothetical protein [Phycisphaerae bacterium]
MKLTFDYSKLTSVSLKSLIGGYDFIIGHCQGVTGKNIFDLSGAGPDAKSYKFVFISIDNPENRPEAAGGRWGHAKNLWESPNPSGMALASNTVSAVL